MPYGLRLKQKHRAKLQRVQKRQNATLRELAAQLGYDPETNFKIVARALDPEHTFQRDVLYDLQDRIEQLEVPS